MSIKAYLFIVRRTDSVNNDTTVVGAFQLDLTELEKTLVEQKTRQRFQKFNDGNDDCCYTVEVTGVTPISEQEFEIVLAEELGDEE